MLKFIKRLLFVFSFLFSVWFILFALSQASSLAQLAGRLHPAAESWVFYGLVGVIVLSFLGFLSVYFTRPKVQVLPDNPTEAEIRFFRQELFKRLRSNPLVKDAGIDTTTEEGAEAAVNLLNDKANQITKAVARQVFLATAVSQNGKADSLIVLASLARMVWNISKLYNQRPQAKELYKLYLNVAASALFASGLEDLGIEEFEVDQLITPLVTTSGLGAIPVAGAIAAKITSSILDGATDAYLALRMGVIARNYMSLNIDPNITMRRKAMPEAGKMLLEISRETMNGIVKGMTEKAIASMSSVASKSGELVSDGAKTVCKGAKATGKAVGSGLKTAAGIVVQGACLVASGVSATGDAVVDRAKKIGRVIGETTKSADRQGKEIKKIDPLP